MAPIENMRKCGLFAPGYRVEQRLLLLHCHRHAESNVVNNAYGYHDASDARPVQPRP